MDDPARIVDRINAAASFEEFGQAIQSACAEKVDVRHAPARSSDHVWTRDDMKRASAAEAQLLRTAVRDFASQHRARVEGDRVVIEVRLSGRLGEEAVDVPTTVVLEGDAAEVTRMTTHISAESVDSLAAVLSSPEGQRLLGEFLPPGVGLDRPLAT